MFSGRTDKAGPKIHERCLGVAAKLKRAKTWVDLRDLVTEAMKRLLEDAKKFLTKACDEHNNFLAKKMIDRRLMEIFEERILSTQERWVEAVEEASVFRVKLAGDLSDQHRWFLAGKLSDGRG